MDPKFADSISIFFDQLFQFLLVFIAAPFILIALLVGILLYWVFKTPREDKIEKWFCEKLSATRISKQSQRGAIRTIRLIFREHIKHYDYLGGHDLNYATIDASIDRVRNICEQYSLPVVVTDHFIDACIALVNTNKYNSIYLRLTTKFQR